VAERNGNRDPEMCPHGVYPAARTAESDTEWVAIAIVDDASWTKFAPLLGGDAAHSQYSALAGRRAREDELDALIANWTAPRSAAEIERTLQSLGIAAHRVSTSVDLLNDPQLVQRRHFLELPHGRFGRTVVENSRYRMSATPARVDRAAPMYGEHNEHVLCELLGYNESRIEALRNAGALFFET
jgi:benzylsuccinate CoA-transferase BbsF subunit